MPTIRHLLDRYGQPPSELAIDWAWQIKQHLDRAADREQTDTRYNQPDDSHACLLACRQWTELNVTEDGHLECDELDCDTARQALEDLQQWSNSRRTGFQPVYPSRTGFQTVSPSETGFQPVELTQSDNSPASEPSHATFAAATRKRTAKRSSFNIGLRDLRMVLARHHRPLSIAAIAILLVGGSIYWATSRKAPVVASSVTSVSSSTSLTVDSSDIPANSHPAANDSMDSSTSDSSVESFEALSLFDPSQLSTTDASSSTPTSVAQLSVDAALGTSPASGKRPSSSAESAESTSEPLGSEAPSMDGAHGADGKLAAGANNSDADNNQSTKPNAETLVEIKQTLKRVEAEESIAVANRHRGVLQDAHGDPWILSRDTLRYRVNLSPQLNVSSRESQWTLALEPIAGLVVEPQRPVTIGPRGLAVWRIYEAEAKSPRACLQVRAFHRGRDGELELVFCGGAEDMPGLSVPLGARWLEPLIVRIQSQAIELRNALSQLSTAVILREQVPAVMQRKQVMVSQMFTATRLGVIMPEINRLAQLVDGQVTMHAALKPKPGEPPVATWGRLP